MYSNSSFDKPSQFLGGLLFLLLPLVAFTAGVTEIQNEAVAVTPDAEVAEAVAANSGVYVLAFTVTNTGDEADTYDLSCLGLSRTECVGADPNRVTLGAGESIAIDVSYRVKGAGTGLVRLTAYSETTGSSDRGSYRVPVTE